MKAHTLFFISTLIFFSYTTKAMEQKIKQFEQQLDSVEEIQAAASKQNDASVIVFNQLKKRFFIAYGLEIQEFLMPDLQLLAKKFQETPATDSTGIKEQLKTQLKRFTSLVLYHHLNREDPSHELLELKLTLDHLFD